MTKKKDLEIIKETLTKQKKSFGNKFGVQINLYGAKGSGKTFKAIEIVKGVFISPIVYRVSDDFDFLPKDRLIEPENLKEDIEPFIEKCIELAKKKKIDVIVLDEADLYLKEVGKFMHLLLDKLRHFFVSVIIITRRPQNINTLASEEAHFYYYYPLQGDNFYKKLKAVGDSEKTLYNLVISLKYQDYRCVFDSLSLTKPIIIEPSK